MALLTARGPLAVIAAALFTAACGTSVADADAGRVVPATRTPAPSPFCLAARGQADALRPLVALAQRGSVPTEQIATAVDAVRRSNIELVAAAPPGLLPDVERYTDTLNAQLDAVARAGGNPQSAVQNPAVIAATAAPDAVAAAQRVTLYITTNCPQRS